MPHKTSAPLDRRSNSPPDCDWNLDAVEKGQRVSDELISIYISGVLLFVGS
jgi:hypothetical protein